jgi:anaerobic magnesium-protoporphyrin IX monomethyl ester cyclase
MSLNILLVLPIREGNNIQIAPDLGIIVLATALQKQACNVTLLDCSKERMNFAAFKEFLKSAKFDVVGFRCYSRDHNYVKHHVKIVRQVSPQAVTLVGGPHPSALPDFVLDTMPDLDFAWKSEAEEGLPKLISLVEKYGRAIPENLLPNIPGLVWRSSEQKKNVINNPAFTSDLDAYGIPAWELIKPDTYPGYIYNEYYPLLTTRGCPYPCIYCNTPGLSGKKLRHRSLDSVIEELTFLKNRYNISRFSIVDDEFTLDRNYAAQFCERLLLAGLNLRWDCPVGLRLDSLNPELLRKMEDSGCECFAVGIESGSERMQKLIGKNITVEKIRQQAFMVAENCSIRAIGYFMLGFPDETEDEIMQTINLATELPLYRAYFSLVIPIPGTKLFADALRENKLSLDKINWDACTTEQVSFERDKISHKRLLQLYRLAYRRFYGRPKILWQLGKASLADTRVIWASLHNLRRLLGLVSSESRIPLYIREAKV